MFFILKHFSMKPLLLFLLYFHPNLSYTQNIPTASETLSILNNTYDFKFKDFYVSEISKVLKTKEFKLVTREVFLLGCGTGLTIFKFHHMAKPCPLAVIL